MSKKSLDFIGPSSTPKKLKTSDTNSTTAISTLSPSTIKSPNEKATVNAVLASLSPQKRSNRSFQGEVTDGDTVIPIFGFDENHRKKLEPYMDDQTPLTLRNCQISLNKAGKFQITIKSYTSIERSSVTYKISDPKTLGSPMITLNDLDDKAEYDRVTVRAKVIKINEKQIVSTGKAKQDISIADSDGFTTLTLWEEDIGLLQTALSYQFNRVLVHKFNGKTTLSLPTFGASIDEIPDIGQTVNDENQQEHLTDLIGVTIQAVNQCEEIFSCFHCKKNTAKSGDISTCTYCLTTQRVSSSVYTARLYVRDINGMLYTLRAYTEALSSIVPSNTISPSALLNARPFSLSFDNFSVIKSVTHSD